MSDLSKSVSVVVPVFNETDSLQELYGEIIDNIQQWSSKEIIFVDDGSTDGSWDVLRSIAENDDSVKLIRFTKNYGKAEALSEGFTQSTGDYIVTMDADLQDDPGEISALINKIEEGWDVVSGWKQLRKDPISKRFPSKIFNFFTRFFAGVNIHDFNCGLKAYKKHVVKSLDIYGGLHRYIPAIAVQKGYSVTEIPVNHRSRKFGITKYGGIRYFHGFFDLLTVLFLGRYTTKPLHLFGFFGITGTLIGVAIECYVLYLKFVLGEPFQLHFALLIFGVLFIVLGIQFFSIGLLGELLVRSNPQTKNRVDLIYRKINK